MKILKRAGTLLSFVCLVPGILNAQSPPDDGGWCPTNLNSWSFSGTNWISDLGYPPISSTNINPSQLGNGTSLFLDSANPAWLQYNVFENDGSTNLTVDSGSISLWFSPNWASATTNQNGT